MTRPKMHGQAGRDLPWPPVDIARAGDHLLVTVALAGVGPQDFRLSLLGQRQLYIEGAVPYCHPLPREHLTMAERTYGPFARTITLPLPVSAEGVSVLLEHGLLTARLPLVGTPITLTWKE